MVPDQAESASIDSLIQAASELIPLLDRTILRLRYSQSLPGVSQLEYRIMDYVCYHGPVRVGDISAMSGLSFPNASRYVKDLIAKGLLAASRDPADGRAQLISTTPGGQDLLNQTEAAIQAQARLVLGQLNGHQRQELETNCRNLTVNLGELAQAMEQ